MVRCRESFSSTISGERSIKESQKGRSERRFEFPFVLDEKVHRPQQVVVVDGPPLNPGEMHPLHPVEDVELGHRVEQAIGNEHFHVRDHIKVMAVSPERAREDLAPPNFFPDPKDPVGTSEIEAAIGREEFRLDLLKAEELAQSTDDLPHFFLGIAMGGVKIDENPLPHLAVLGAVGFHQVE